MSKEHDRIWLEPAPSADEEYGQQWCQDNVWGDDAIEYVRAALAIPAMSKEHTPPAQEGWTKIPEGDLPIELLKSINIDNQVLAYENGRYYNAWFTFEPSEGGWFWTDDADSEPNPSHYRQLPPEPSATPSHPMKEED